MNPRVNLDRASALVRTVCSYCPPCGFPMDGQKNVACLDAKCWSWAFLALVCLLSCLFFSAQTSHLVWFGLGMP